MRKKRTPCPRWAKILRNLLLLALLGFLMWDTWDQPTFSYRADLRRTERECLIPEAVEVLEINTARGAYRIELADDVAVTSYPTRGRFFASANVSVHPLQEGSGLLCVPLPVERVDEVGQPITFACYAAVRPPADAADAVLTLHMLEDDYNEPGDYVFEGVQEGGAFLFYARPEPDEDGTVFMGSNWFLPGKFTYEVQFFDADGTKVGQISG